MNLTEYRKAQAAIGTETAEKVTALYDVFASAGRQLTADEFANLVGVLVSGGNRRAALLADTFQRAELRKAPLGVGRRDEEPTAMRDTVKKLLDDDEDPLPRMQRLAVTEPVQASRQAAREVLERSGAKFYTWRLSNKDACRLCKLLSRRRWPVSKVPVSHPSCTCQVVPTRGGKK